MNNKDEIIVVASDDETFEKYGDEIDFIVEVEWDQSSVCWTGGVGGPFGELEEFVDAKLKVAKLNDEFMPLNVELEQFAIKKLKEGWLEANCRTHGYSGEILDIWAKRERDYLEDYLDPESFLEQ